MSRLGPLSLRFGDIDQVIKLPQGSRIEVILNTADGRRLSSGPKLIESISDPPEFQFSNVPLGTVSLQCIMSIGNQSAPGPILNGQIQAGSNQLSLTCQLPQLVTPGPDPSPAPPLPTRPLPSFPPFPFPFPFPTPQETTLTFSRVVISVDPDLLGTFTIGQTLTGSYSFNPSTPPVLGSTSSFAVFNALSSLSFTVGSYSASSTAAPEIQVDNAPGAPNDRYAVVSRASEGLSGPDVNGIALEGFAFRVDDASNTVFDTALELPDSVNLQDFDSSAFFIFFDEFDGGRLVVGELTALSP